MFKTPHQSISELFERSKRDLLDYLSRRVGRDDAPDLLQDTFVRALRSEQFPATTNPPAFLKQIAVNLTRDHFRRRDTQTSYFARFGDFVVEPPSDDRPIDERLDYQRKTELLRQAVEALSPRCRQVFMLHIYEDIALDEIARRLEISDRMARKHLSAGFHACRAALRSSEE